MLNIIYTDGGCDCRDGHGAWAYVDITNIYNRDTVEVITEYHCPTTNNRMEMMAIQNAMRDLVVGSKTRIFSDSGYCVNGYNHPSYLNKWKNCGWKTSNKKDVENRDLWEELLRLECLYKFDLCLIKGHSKDKASPHKKWNDIVDDACTWTMQNGGPVSVRHKLIYDIKSEKPHLIDHMTMSI